MNHRIVLLILIIIVSFTACVQKQYDVNLENFTKEEISSEELNSWAFYGLGNAYEAGGGQYCLAENDSTYGVVLISPESYKGDVVIRYETMTLTPATVLVVMLSASDQGPSADLNIPVDYNGNMGLWVKEKENYFIAFRNESHNFTPFIRKYPVPGGESLAAAPENIMIPGKYYAIEIGRVGNEIWLSIDGKRVVEAKDDDASTGGHIVFRIRGTANFKAACLIKELEIFSM